MRTLTPRSSDALRTEIINDKRWVLMKTNSNKNPNIKHIGWDVQTLILNGLETLLVDNLPRPYVWQSVRVRKSRCHARETNLAMLSECDTWRVRSPLAGGAPSTSDVLHDYYYYSYYYIINCIRTSVYLSTRAQRGRNWTTNDLLTKFSSFLHWTFFKTEKNHHHWKPARNKQN